ncbi:TPA: hypothetical protein ACSPZ4_001255 [Aeromonas veronii]
MIFGNRIGGSIGSIGAASHQHCRQNGAIVPQSAHDYQRSHVPSGGQGYIRNRKKSAAIRFLALKKGKEGKEGKEGYRGVYDSFDNSHGSW